MKTNQSFVDVKLHNIHMNIYNIKNGNNEADFTHDTILVKHSGEN